MKIKFSSINIFFYALLVFILTRQVPFLEYNIIANLSLVIILVIYLITFNKRNFPYILLLFLWLLLLSSYSFIFEGNDTNLAIRFAIILFSIIISHYVTLSENIKKWFYFAIFIQCLFIIFMEFYMNYKYTQYNYSELRHFFLGKKWGDIYTYNGLFYRIQVAGNALLTFAFMLTFIKEINFRRLLLVRIILLTSIIIAGNFAYLVSICVFLIGWYVLFSYQSIREKMRNILILVIILLVSLIPIIDYVIETILRKDTSLGTRWDQFDVLISDLFSSSSTALWGKGLGNTIDVVTSFRDYTGNIYYELQSVYFFNQLGIINTLIFMIILIYLALSRIKYKDLLYVYFCYIIYAITNPYILDMNHVVVIIMLCSIKVWRENERKKNW